MGAGLSPAAADTGRRGWRWWAIRLIAIAVLVTLVVWANLYAAEHDFVRDLARRFGYGGLLLAAAASGFNLVVPVPIITFMPFLLDSGFEAGPAVMTIALGMTLGDLLGYLIGRTTREAMGPRDHGIIRRLERIRDRHPKLPFVVMFLYASFAPVPNEILVIPLAFLRYPLLGIFVAVLAGNMIFNSLVAFGVIRIFG